MISAKEKMQMVKDLPNKKLTITRQFDAPVEKVWRAWTESDLLDQWWAPKPYQAETKSMNFKPGGVWLYAMVGPDNFKQWCKAEYTSITPNKSFQAVDMFCDENGNRNQDFPSMNWKVNFSPVTSGTKVLVEITFGSEADLQKILETGFEEGFAMGLGNLEELFSKGKI